MVMKKKDTPKVIDYGTEKQTIPVYIPDKRYRALKGLVLERNKPLNQLVRDAIEEVYGEDLDRIEKSFSLPRDVQESSLISSKAHERMKM